MESYEEVGLGKLLLLVDCNRARENASEWAKMGSSAIDEGTPQSMKRIVCEKDWIWALVCVRVCDGRAGCGCSVSDTGKENVSYSIRAHALLAVLLRAFARWL